MLYSHLLYTLTILFIYLKSTESWYHFIEISNCSDEIKVEAPEEPETILEIYEDNSELYNNHLSNDCCPFQAVKIINPCYGQCRRTDDRKVIPICLKCAACLAVAENIRRVFDEIIANGNEDYELEESTVMNATSDLCSNHFKNYDLRDYRGFAIVTDASSALTEHVKSALDGQWNAKLGKMCLDFTRNMNAFDVYSLYKSNTLNLTDFLCRGSGIFRECYNIPFETIELPDDDPFYSKIWVHCNIFT